MYLLFLSEFRVLNFFMNFFVWKEMHDRILQQKKKLPWDPKFHKPSLTACDISIIMALEKTWSKFPQTVPLINC